MSSDTSKARAVKDNAISASTNTNPLKIQIEYTDAKGKRITVDKDVAIPASGLGSKGRQRTQDNSSNLSSYLLYVVLGVIAGARVFFYRRRKKEVKQADLINPTVNSTQER